MKKSNRFDKFAKKKSNAAIKEQYRQEKRKVKKQREEYFEKKKAELAANPGKSPTQPILTKRSESEGSMPLNKFIAHAGIDARREASEMRQQGLDSVHNGRGTGPARNVRSRDQMIGNGQKSYLATDLVYILSNSPKGCITSAH